MEVVPKAVMQALLSCQSQKQDIRSRIRLYRSHNSHFLGPIGDLENSGEVLRLLMLETGHREDHCYPSALVARIDSQCVWTYELHEILAQLLSHHVGMAGVS